MKIYKDPEGKEEIDLIHFGKVKVGEKKTLTLYIKNDSKAVLTNLKFSFPDLPLTETLRIDDPPLTIQPNKTEILKITWIPSSNFKQALSVGLLITGEEVYLAEISVSVKKTSEEG